MQPMPRPVRLDVASTRALARYVRYSLTRKNRRMERVTSQDGLIYRVVPLSHERRHSRDPQSSAVRKCRRCFGFRLLLFPDFPLQPRRDLRASLRKPWAAYLWHSSNAISHEAATWRLRCGSNEQMILTESPQSFPQSQPPPAEESGDAGYRYAQSFISPHSGWLRSEG